MATVISFEDRAMASLRRRVAEVEEANQDLIAFARGHSGAAAAVHGAVLAAIEADSLDHLVHIVTQLWPDMLGLDAVALAFVAGEQGFRADDAGLHRVDPRMVDRAIGAVEGVLLRAVTRGHAVFGPACDLIRAEALIRFEPAAPLPSGMLALGQRGGGRFDTRRSSELLRFLGDAVARMIARWPAS